MTGAVRVGRGRILRGEVRVPGDKSIAHRALLLGALGEGTSVVRGFTGGADVEATSA
jgi:3-phosphoshikimate 1-carboxyvinyltransferase